MHIQLQRRGPLEVVADALASAIERGIDYVTRPKTDALEFLTSTLPMVPALIKALQPSAPVDLDGPKVQQVRRELAACEAQLSAEHAEKRARLVAEFGPRFDEARASDEAQYGDDEPAHAAPIASA